MNSPAIPPLVQDFFTGYLLNQKRVSPQTVGAYRDTFRLLFNFLLDTTKSMPSTLCLEDLNPDAILAFLEYLEKKRGNSVRSRNARLAALRSFFRFVALKEPGSVDLVTRVLAIPNKRACRRLIGYLTRQEMTAILAAPNLNRWAGRRDHALLLTMYNTGARVSEICTLQCSHISFGENTSVHLHGKGRKERAVPLWKKTAKTLKAWFNELGAPLSRAFPNAMRKPMTRHGISYILTQCVLLAQQSCSSLTNKKVTPHIIRHTTAMHLLQAGVDLAVIAMWLGHENLETTHMYIEADLAMKEKALEKVPPLGGAYRRFKANDKLISFLETL